MVFEIISMFFPDFDVAPNFSSKAYFSRYLGFSFSFSMSSSFPIYFGLGFFYCLTSFSIVGLTTMLGVGFVFHTFNFGSLWM